MKVAFVSDTHFGYRRFEKDALQQGTNAILDACKKADILLLGGDIFDSKNPNLNTLTHVATLLQQAQKILPDSKSPKILAIHGTHELSSKDSINPISMMAKLGLIEDVHNKTVVMQKNDEKIAVSGLGGIPDDLVKTALTKLNCKPIGSATNFFMFHQTLHEFVPQAKNLASTDDLPEGYDFYLCGHIHSKKEYLGGKLLISGSTVLTQQKDEEQNKKGYFIIDTKTKTKEFIEIKTRPFIVSELNFEDAIPTQIRIKINEELQNLLSQTHESVPILKIKLTGSLQKGYGDLDLSGFNPKNAYLTIDNQLEGSSLLDKIQKLKGQRL